MTTRKQLTAEIVAQTEAYLGFPISGVSGLTSKSKAALEAMVDGNALALCVKTRANLYQTKYTKEQWMCGAIFGSEKAGIPAYSRKVQAFRFYLADEIRCGRTYTAALAMARELVNHHGW